MRGELSTRARGLLASLVEEEGYQVLLDIMEMACIEFETVLLNTDPARHDAVLANHQQSRAAWQVFVSMQQRVKAEVQQLRRAQSNVPAQSTEDDRDVLDITDPFNDHGSSL